MLKQAGELGFSVGHEVHLVLAVATTLIGKSCYDLPQNKETLVNVDALFGLHSGSAGEALLLRPCEIHQLEFADSHHFLFGHILRLDGKTEDGVRATRHIVQVVRCQDSVLGPDPEEFEGIFCRF